MHQRRQLDTLLDVMAHACELGDQAPKQGFFDPTKNEVVWASYSSILATAFGFGRMLAERGVRANDPCWIAAADRRVTLTAFYAAISLGARPMILPAPKPLGAPEASIVDDVRSWLADPERRGALVHEPALDGAEPLVFNAQKRAISLSRSELDGIQAFDVPARSSRPNPDEIAYFQATSATTGRAKALAITHRNVLHNVGAARSACECGDDERMSTWLPLFHDMGLVGGELFNLCNGYDVVSMRPFDFLKRPLRWLRSISDHRCTMSPAPNFAYEYTADRVSDDVAAGLDLRCWKIAYNGAEPLRAPAMQKFCRRFQAAGFRESAFCACYGLAENTLAVTMSRTGEGPRHVVISRPALEIGEPVTILARGSLAHADPLPPDAVTIFAVGTPVAATDVSIRDESGRELRTERTLGEVVVRGPSLTRGYVQDFCREPVAFDGELKTGDLGFLDGGELYIVERLKNVIIANGANHSSSLLEHELASRLQISESRIAVFESDLMADRSEIVAIVELMAGERSEAYRARTEASLISDLQVARVFFAKSGTIPRTTSGKKQHFLCRKKLRAGELS